MPRTVVARSPQRVPTPATRPAPATDLNAAMSAAQALPRSTGAEGSEPLINAREAARLRKALPTAPAEVKALVKSLEGKSGGIAQALLLRAISARAERLNDPQALQVLKTFAAAIKNLPAATLREKASVLDLDSAKNTSSFNAQTLEEKLGAARRASDGGDDGLLQRFTATCGPTVVQMVLAEADPVVAFAINSEGRAAASAHDKTAAFQRAVLEEFGGIALPRYEASLAAKLKEGLSGLGNKATDAQREALKKYALHHGPLDAKAQRALEVMRKTYKGFPSAAEVKALRAVTLPSKDEGLGTAELLKALGKYVKTVTGAKYRATPADGYARGQAGKHLDAVAQALAAGHDVPFGISEPGHWMLLTATRTGHQGREFLVSDPKTGRTAWCSEASLASGEFASKQFKLNGPRERPYIDTFVLPSGT